MGYPLAWFARRLNERYKGCVALARLLLSRLSLHEKTGPVPVSSFLIDMNRLFEHFVAAALRPGIETADGKLETQRAIRITVAENAKEPIRGIVDIIVRRSDGSLVALDTKYKDPGHERWGTGDIYQMAAYCQATPSKLGILIYASPSQWQWSKRLTNSEVTVSAISLPLNGSRKLILQRIRHIASTALNCPRFGSDKTVV